ncbi:MAG: 50S ribosome-binding GTPase, partial [Geminicoccaceae bacterium]|nr:50S ribosome-binding GTPase [Geminicoccaceae bacterium]
MRQTIAIIGRPNVGKSSLVNRLLGDERQLTGPEPGLTRDAVMIDWQWRGRHIRLVDTAG